MEQTQNTPKVHTAFNPSIIIGSPTGVETSGELIINQIKKLRLIKDLLFGVERKFFQDKLLLMVQVLMMENYLWEEI
ncbi:MAG: hypothetical protein K2X69_03495 [Silvanigrellaceae bacterium]|nr:hypothetical protein [Silvanigrellaceae bacterium]